MNITHMAFNPEYAYMYIPYYASGVFPMRELSRKSTMNFDKKNKDFQQRKRKYCLQNVSHFVLAAMY